MNSILRKLTNEMYQTDTNHFYKKVGNYAVARDYYFYTENYCIRHFYYGKIICMVNVNKKEFELHNHNYNNSRLTTAQLNFLEQFYKNKGYKLIYRGE